VFLAAQGKYCADEVGCTCKGPCRNRSEETLNMLQEMDSRREEERRREQEQMDVLRGTVWMWTGHILGMGLAAWMQYMRMMGGQGKLVSKHWLWHRAMAERSGMKARCFDVWRKQLLMGKYFRA